MSKRILIVESDTGVSSAMRSALEGRGFSVEETTDGKGAVEKDVIPSSAKRNRRR